MMRPANVRKQLAGLITVIALLAAVVASGQAASSAGKLTDERSKLIGNWSGESICVGNRPACHDEQVVYRIALSPDPADTVIITMDKIIDGKPDTMAVLDFKYDSEQGTLVNEFTRGTTHGRWAFTVKGDTIEGTLIILPAKTIGRRVKVFKDKS
jgi:hypothetical protein